MGGVELMSCPCARDLHSAVSPCLVPADVKLVRYSNHGTCFTRNGTCVMYQS